MSQIKVSNLTFSYDTSHELIFDHVSFTLDTDWKLGFTGRNGRGKTTFLNLLMGKYEYGGFITASVDFDYFPYEIKDQSITALKVIKQSIWDYETAEKQMDGLIAKNSPESLEQYGALLEEYIFRDGYIIEELIIKELFKLDVSEDAINRPFSTLSNGEKTKAMLASLFLKKNHFLLIDEPTNHLDAEGRKTVASYLSSKKGFILVSHDRQFLDATTDHILSINKANVEIIKGNYSTWQQNKELNDSYEIQQNEKLKKEIKKLSEATKRTAAWSDKIEASKIGTHVGDRGFIGHKAEKMMRRSKATAHRQEKALEDKSKLLKNIEYADELKLTACKHHAKTYVEAENLCINYGSQDIISNLSFSLQPGDRLFLKGPNGSGKSSLIKLLTGEPIPYRGKYKVAQGLVISYVPQDSSTLKGDLKEFAVNSGIDETLFKSILRKLDFSREQFEKDMKDYSQGQKKKVLIAKSLCARAHLYIWDEPLNYIDVLSRIQIEKLIKTFEPTMIIVEHDAVFEKETATKIVEL